MKPLMLGLSCCALAWPPTSREIHAALPNQPIVERYTQTEFDHGAYSVHQVPLSTPDLDEAKAYDNFSLETAYTIDAISWSGIFAEPIPDPPANVDFLLEIWRDDQRMPALTTPLHSFFLAKGPAGESGGNVTVSTPATGAHVSPLTDTTVGGGPALSYEAPLPATVISKGDYWISIQAVQSFNSQLAVDPEWQWHIGSGPADGFLTADRALSPETWPEGSRVPDKDLAFTLHGEILQLDCNRDGAVNSLDLRCGCDVGIEALASELDLILGDLDGNGAVAFADFLVLSNNYGQEVEGYQLGDLDCDGQVAFADFLILSANYGQSSTASFAAVPEPCNLMSILLALVGLFAASHSSRSLQRGLPARGTGNY